MQNFVKRFFTCFSDFFPQPTKIALLLQKFAETDPYALILPLKA